MVISVFHFLWFLIGSGWQCCIKTSGTQKLNPSALLLSCRKYLCFSLSLPITLLFDISAGVLKKWMASLLKLGPWFGDNGVGICWAIPVLGAASGLPSPAGGLDVNRSSHRSTREATQSQTWPGDPSIPPRFCEQKSLKLSIFELMKNISSLSSQLGVHR